MNALLLPVVLAVASSQVALAQEFTVSSDHMGRLVARATDFSARFDGAGFEFATAQGGTLRLAAEALERGDARLVLASAEPVADGAFAVFERAPGVRERFEASADGIEHSLVIDEQLGSDGDLVVRFALAGESAARGERRLDGSHVFGTISYGRLVGIDADGDRTEGDVRLANGGLEWVIADEWLDTATWPITLDPLVGSEHDVTDWVTDQLDEFPFAAHDVTNQVSLVVFERTEPDLSKRMVAQRVDPNGVNVGADLQVTTWSASRGVRVASVNKVNRFAVVWIQDYTTGSAEIRLRWVEANTGVMSNPIVVATLDSDDLDSVSIAGESSNETAIDPRAFVTWCDRTLGVRMARVDVSGSGAPTVVSTTTLFADNDLFYSYSAVRSSTCTSADGKLGLTWLRTGPTSSTKVLYASVVDRGLSVFHTPTLISGAATGVVNASIDGGDTNPSRYVVAFEDETGQSTEKYLYAVALASQGLTLTVGSRVELEHVYGSSTFRTPSVAWRPGQVFVAYYVAGEIVVRGLDAKTALPCEPLSIVATYSSGTFPAPWNKYQGQPHICLQTSGGNTKLSRGLILRSEYLKSLTSDKRIVVARPFDAFSPLATAVYIDAGCGNVGTIAVAQPPAIGNATFAVQLQFPGPGLVGILNIAAPQPLLSCGVCQFVPLATTQIVNLNAFGVEVPLPIPANASLAGAQAWLQWIVYAPGVAPCGPIPDFGASDILELTLN